MKPIHIWSQHTCKANTYTKEFNAIARLACAQSRCIPVYMCWLYMFIGFVCVLALYVYWLHMCIGFVCVLALYVYWLHMCIGFVCVLALYVYWLHMCIGFISRTNQRSAAGLQYDWECVCSFGFFWHKFDCSSQCLEKNTTQHKKPFLLSYCSSEWKFWISRQNFQMHEPTIRHYVLTQKRLTHTNQYAHTHTHTCTNFLFPLLFVGVRAQLSRTSKSSTKSHKSPGQLSHHLMELAKS